MTNELPLPDCITEMGVEYHSTLLIREYGKACAAAERERCAKVCEDLGYLLDDSGAYAAAIRA